jgi:hypothetical protein
MPKSGFILTKNHRLLLVSSLLAAALYIWAFGFNQHEAHFNFMAQIQARQAQATKTAEQTPNTVAPEQMPSGLYPALLQSQQAEPSGAYVLTEAANGLVAKNPAQSFETHFTQNGPALPGWQMQLAGVGWAGENLAPSAPVAPRTQNQRVEYRRMGGLTEWYLNGPLGLEQGFTLAQPLAVQPESNSWLALDLSLERASAVASGQGDWVVINPAKGQAVRYGKLYAYDADGTPLPSRLEVAPGGKGLRLLADVQGAHYPVTIDPFLQQQILTASDGAANDNFGYSVALNSTGDTALIGANTIQGSVYVFTRTGATWSQQQVLTDTTGASGDEFGFSVALNSTGDTALIGNPYKKVSSNTNQGTAYVFTRSGTVWSQQQVLSDTTTGASSDQFGWSVALSSAGDTALIGAYGKKINSNSSQGAAYVLTRTGATWSQQQILSDTITGASSDNFGFSVTLNGTGDTALIGAYYKKVGTHVGQGAAYVFTRSGTVWSQQQVLTDTTGAFFENFGTSVALNSTGDTALLGTPSKQVGNNTNQGVVFAFIRTGSSWSQQQVLSDTTTGASSDEFGYSVALNSTGDTALIGAFGKKVNSNTNQGAAYVFTRSGTVWSQQQIISDTIAGATNDDFGLSADLSSAGDTVLTGALGQNSHQGAAYVYTTTIACPAPQVVTYNSDDGVGTSCGTFSYAISHSAGLTVTFSLTPTNIITFSGSLAVSVASGVTIDGGTGIVLNGNGVAGDGLRLQGSDTLIHLTIRNFAGREIVTLGTGNKFQYVVIQQT